MVKTAVEPSSVGRPITPICLETIDRGGSVGVSSDTSVFAVNSIRAWWAHLGRARYPHATALTITADGGGSNSSRTRLWKLELQKLADELGFVIRVCHFPPGNIEVEQVAMGLRRTWER